MTSPEEPRAEEQEPAGARVESQVENRSDELDLLGDWARTALERANRVREEALALSRELIRASANSIRATHREQHSQAETLLDRAGELAAALLRLREDRPEIFFTGYVQDSLKEWTEARCVYAVINGFPLPDPDTMAIPWPAFLNGLGETVGEMRRHCLDLLRQGETGRAESILEVMDGIYTLLTTMDYPDAVTGGLRRTTDAVRGILERTRADLTTAVMQGRLDRRMADLIERLDGPG